MAEGDFHEEIYSSKDQWGRNKTGRTKWKSRELSGFFLKEIQLKGLVSWCFEPSQPQTSGLNTNFTLSPSYSFHKSPYHKSCFLSLFTLRRYSTREPASGRVAYLFCGPTQEPCVSHSQHRKNQERFGKNADEWTRRVEIGKEEIPGSKRSMYGYILTFSRL